MTVSSVPELGPFVHLLAYGNSDQASFRHPDVRDAMDLMTVPGTIASYYDEATAAFVLSVEVPYLIDPRTPLFQNVLDSPRASHYTLGEWHGRSVDKHMRASMGEDVNFPPSFWTDEVVEEMVGEVIGRQRNYADKASTVTEKLDRYSRLLAEAMAEYGVEPPESHASSPDVILAPYFAVTGELDPWWNVMRRVWENCLRLDDPGDIRPVLCVGPRFEASVEADGIQVLEELLPRLPEGLAQSCLFWITGFDERAASIDQLVRLYRLVKAQAGTRSLVNLYGGFFSICLRHAGLVGFGNGLTYSESRAWPALSSTGAAPPRYYVPRLHKFLPQAAAAELVRVVPSMECPCQACADLGTAGESIAAMPYHQLKRHFALARQWEIEFVAHHSLEEIATALEAAKAEVTAVSAALPRAANTDLRHLETWASALRAAPLP